MLNKKLKKISNDLFEESIKVDDKNISIQWRRNFHPITLNLKNIKLHNIYDVHGIEFNHELNEKIQQIAPDVKTTICITGELIEELFKDRLFVAAENKAEKNTVSIERPKGPTLITLKSGSPAKAQGSNVLDGLYNGQINRFNLNPNEDYLGYHLSIPADQMNHLIQTLKENDSSTIEICTQLFAYTSESEDFLREPYHSRDLIINEAAQSYVSWVQVTSKIGHEFKIDLEDDSESQFDFETESHQELTAVNDHIQHAQLKILESYIKPINGIINALWVLIIVIVLHAFFK